MNFDEQVLAAIVPLRAAGFALHYLHPRDKAPIGAGWSEQPVATIEQLRSTHRHNYNLGVRLGEPSHLADGYLHTFDIDIRHADLADEAWAAFAKLLPGVDPATLPTVASGSGGESRHLFFVTDRPFHGRKVAVSEGKYRRFDKKLGREVWSYLWEIELFGTGKQVVLPPSIHPETRLPYRWLREFDFDDFAPFPSIPAASIESLGVAETGIYEFEEREPLVFKEGQLDRVLNDVPNAFIDDYHRWITLGQALHHQFGGSDAGYGLWIKHSQRSDKFDGADSRELLRKWRGFGKNRRKPVTMASVVEWAQQARVAGYADAFDDVVEQPQPAAGPPESRGTPAFDDDFGDLDAPAAPVDDFDDLDTPSTATSGGLDDFDAPLTEVEQLMRRELGWVSLLDVNEEGAVKGTLHNIELIVRNDPRLLGLPQLNEFTLEPVQRSTPGKKPQRERAAKDTRQLTGPVWQVKDTLNGDLWSDDRDFAIRSILEAPATQGGYGVKITDRDLKAAIVLAAADNRFHPVREYLESVAWDGVARCETLFIDYVGAPDDVYTRSIARLLMVGAVTRIYEPGHKFDFAVILEGLQGKGKSTFIQTLGRHWFAELDGDFHDSKQMIELMQGAWVMEIPELSGFGRADVRAIKAFISRQKDRARLAYARRAGEFPRQVIFIGSTNDREYLKDDSGGRRFWPMMCNAVFIDIARLGQNVDQLWAEAVSIYQSMRAEQPYGTLPLYLTDPEAEKIAKRLQESRRVESSDDALAGRVAEWLAAPITSGSLDDDLDADGNRKYRTETCLVEIWIDCLKNDPRAYNQAAAQSLGRAMRLVPNWDLCTIGTGRRRFPTHGQQRFYSLGGDAGYLERGGLS